MMVSLSDLSSEQSTATQRTQDDIDRFMEYCATHPDAVIRYQASDMQLMIHSDAAYLSAPQSRSRAGGNFYLGNQPNNPPIFNGPILNPTGILKHVASAASEAELGALFVNCKEGTVIHHILTEMGHEQNPTSVQTDNSTANGIINKTIKQQRARALDMQYYWVRDRVKQGHFHIFWAPGKSNLVGDYMTNHHSPVHHRQIHPAYLHCPPARPRTSSITPNITIARAAMAIRSILPFAWPGRVY
jgi:hypothetical protein